MDDDDFVSLCRPGMHIDELQLSLAAAGVKIEQEEFCHFLVKRHGASRFQLHAHWQFSVARNGVVTYSAFGAAGWHYDPKTVVKLLLSDG